MKIPAIIMAGGRGSRFNFRELNLNYNTKLLLPLNNKSIIEHVIDATIKSERINRVILAISPFTSSLKDNVQLKTKPIEIIETSGEGYHQDLSLIMKQLNLKITITIAGDIPLLKPEFLDAFIIQYFKLNKPAISVMADYELFKQQGLTPTTSFIVNNGQKKIVPLGINIIDGKFLDQSEMEQIIILCEKLELLYNINTINDYFQLKSLLNEFI